jgi:putative intracellular protease/amidase
MFRSLARIMVLSSATLSSCAQPAKAPPAVPASTNPPASFASTAPKGKVLFVMSAAHELELKDGKLYATGTYLGETAVPLRAILAAGYTPVFASPGGVPPSVDRHSEELFYYNGDPQSLKADQELFQRTEGLQHPRTLAEVAKEGVSDYVGVLVPGGFAPVQDLPTNRDLGLVLRAFHEAAKPTAMICHGPIALLSTLADPRAFEGAMIAGDLGKANTLAAGWPYAGYRLTVFSSTEELLALPQLGGNPKYYVSDALSQAGAHVDRLSQGAVNVIVDRELVTAQQPFSADAFAKAFVDKLNDTPAPNP